MRFALWITKATKTHTIGNSYFFHGNSGYANMLEYYVIKHCLSSLIYVLNEYNYICT